MNEYHIGYLAVGSLIGLSLASLLYMMGGRNNKGIRRFGASFIVAMVVNVASLLLGVYSFKLLAVYPFKIMEYIQGYSNDRGMPGWLKRFLIALTATTCCAYLCWIFGCWWMLIPQVIISTSTVFFSFKNPIYASAEEPLVCFLNSLVAIFIPFVV